MTICKPNLSNKTINQNEKYFWKDDVLNLLKLHLTKHSMEEVKLSVLKNFGNKSSNNFKYKSNTTIKYNKELWSTLGLPKYSNSIRLSLLLSYLSKFIIQNDRPHGIEYYSIDYDSKILSENEIAKLLNNL